MKKKLEKDAKHIHNPQTLIRGTERRITMEVTSASPFALDGGSDEPNRRVETAHKKVSFFSTLVSKKLPDIVGLVACSLQKPPPGLRAAAATFISIHFG